MAGPNCSAMIGQIVEVDNDTGISLISGGYAELVRRGPVGVEAATVELKENTDARPPAKAKQRGKK